MLFFLSVALFLVRDLVLIVRVNLVVLVLVVLVLAVLVVLVLVVVTGGKQSQLLVLELKLGLWTGV